MTWLRRNLTHWTCGSRRSRSLTSLSIFSQPFTTTLESTLSRLSCTISTLSSKSSNSTSKSLLRCKLTSFRTPGCSKSSKDLSTTFSKNAREASPTSWSSPCTAESILRVKSLFLTRAMWRRCISSDKAWLKSSITRMTRSRKRSQSFICLNSLTSETTKFCQT